MAVKKVAQNPVMLASRNSYNTQPIGLFQLYCKSSVATIKRKKITVISIFEIAISQNTKYDNLVGF